MVVSMFFGKFMIPKVDEGTKETFAGFLDKTMEVVDDVFDGSEYKKEKRKAMIPKAKKALKKQTQKAFNTIETMWYVCGTASRDPNYNNMARKGGDTVSQMLKGTEEGLSAWMVDHLNGCKESHIARANSRAEKLFGFIKKRACSFVSERHCA